MFFDMELVKMGGGPNDLTLCYYDRYNLSFTKRHPSLTSCAASSIVVLVEAGSGVKFYNITMELAYLCVEVGLTVIYTVLVINRLFAMRGRMRQVMAQYDSSTYDTIALMVIESAAPYTVFAIVFIVSFAMYSTGLTTLCFLSIGKIQVSKHILVNYGSDASYSRALPSCSSSFVLHRGGQSHASGRPELPQYIQP